MSEPFHVKIWAIFGDIFMVSVSPNCYDNPIFYLLKVLAVNIFSNGYISMGESNTVVSTYTFYRHLQQYCSHPSICR